MNTKKLSENEAHREKKNINNIGTGTGNVFCRAIRAFLRYLADSE